MRRWIAPCLLALVVAAVSLRHASDGGPVDTDAARHAMNGAFLFDMAREGGLGAPLEFGKSYYSRLPALTIPYHPPLFPAVEAAAYAVFGVSALTARLLVALLAALGALLFYRLIVETTGSHLAAACTVATFCFWRVSRTVSSDVMLEFPAFLPMILALWRLRKLERGLTLADGLWFGLLAGAAVWTKQHALFLGGVPFAAILFANRWRELKRPAVWAGSVLFGLLTVALVMLSAPIKSTGVDQLVYEADSTWFREVPIHNLLFYIGVFRPLVGTAPVLLLGVAAALWAWRLRGRNPGLWLYWAWASSAFFLLLVLGPYDERYLFFVYPPLLAIAYVTLVRGVRDLLPRSFAWTPAAGFTAAAVAAGLAAPTPLLRGPAEAAALVVNEQPRRVLYCGSADGNFIFAVRALDPAKRTVVIRGETLLDPPATPQQFADRLREYGVTHAVIEHTARSQPCNAIGETSLPDASPAGKVVMASSLPRFHGGTLEIYRLNPPAGASGSGPLKVRVPKIGGAVELEPAEARP